MKKIEAIVRPYKLDDLRDALAKIGVTGMSIYEMKGLGRQRGHTERYRGIAYKVDFLNKIKIEMIIEESQVDDCLRVIEEAARTGKIGDGKIIVTPVEKVIRIRTGEVDQYAV